MSRFLSVLCGFALTTAISAPASSQTLFLNRSIASGSQVSTGSSTVDNILFGTQSVNTPSAGSFSRSTAATGGLFGSYGSSITGGRNGTLDEVAGGLTGSTSGLTGGSSGSVYGTTGGLGDNGHQSLTGGSAAVTAQDIPVTSTGGTNTTPLTSLNQ